MYYDSIFEWLRDPADDAEVDPGVPLAILDIHLVSFANHVPSH
jgi:hypothetical protein